LVSANLRGLATAEAIGTSIDIAAFFQLASFCQNAQPRRALLRP
jgi:hypothetical protein